MRILVGLVVAVMLLGGAAAAPSGDDPDSCAAGSDPDGQRDPVHDSAELTIRLVTEGLGTGAGVICLLDENGRVVWNEARRWHGGESYSWVRQADATLYGVGLVVFPGGYIEAWLALDECASMRGIVELRVTYGSPGVSLRGGNACLPTAYPSSAPAGLGEATAPDPPEGAMEHEPASTPVVLEGTSVPGPRPGETLAVGFGSVVAAAAWWGRWWVVSLFSRVEGPQAARHPVRSDILALVRSDPGASRQEIARRLGLAEGQASHHLRVLLRSRLLDSVSSRGQLHFFPHGSYGPAEKARLAMGRSGPEAEVLRVLERRSSASLQEIREAVGLSLAAVSRLVGRMETRGVVRKRRAGRRVIVEAASL